VPYITPSVLVYQQLANSGGVANITPDLQGVIVGPLYNVIDFDVSSTISLAASIAGSFNYLEEDPAAGTAPATEDFSVPSTYPGQVIQAGDVADIEIWFKDASIETFSDAAVTLATAVDATDVIITVGTDPTALDAGGVAKVQVGDRVALTPDAGTSLITTVAAVTATTITVTDLITPALVGITADFSVAVHRTYSTIQSTGGTSTTTTAADGIVTLTHASLTTTHGIIDKAEVHIAYRALRLDLGGQVLDIADITDAAAQLGSFTNDNPLGLGIQLALANTITSMRAISVDSDDLAGYQAALEVAEGSEDVYSLVPLTQTASIIAAFKTHVEQMSTPQEAGWRIALVNEAIPDTQEIGPTGGYDNTTGSIIDLGGSDFVLQDTTGTFLSDGYRPGDIVTVVDVGATESGDYIIDVVLNNNQMRMTTAFSAVAATTAFTVNRTLTKQDKADHVEGISTALGSNRIVHIQPDSVGVDINGTTTYVEGFYLAAAVAGLVAGFPVQQGLTNISVAGITDIQKSNFYFTRAQMGTMAGAGTMLFAQLVQGGTPYCRHELTTDMSTLAYRELMKVKNLDFLSYYFRSFLTPFIGKWNITEDTLNIMRQTIIAASEQIKSQKLPRIGAPLTSFNLVSLEQDENNKDNVNITLEVAIADPNNYTNLYLVI